MSLKQSIQRFLFPLHTTQTIRFGYLKSKKLILSVNTQWAPLFGRWEPAMQRIIVNVVKEGDTVYDLGANFGLHGMLCSTLIGRSGLLYNFEPLPSNIKEIEDNYKLNDITNYKNIQKAISNQNSTVGFNIAGHPTQGKLVDVNKGNNVINVEAITLDQFIADGNRLPNFIKMDIEGAEGDALEGYAKSIEKTFPLMIIELHSPEADKKVGEFLKYFKYKAYRFNTFHSLHFEAVKNLSLPHPHKEGIWGSVLCIGPDKSIGDFSFDR